jgi:apolipoprotein N-acyltransferase
MFAFLAGVVSALAMPPFNLVFVLLLTFPVLLWLIDSATSEPASGVVARFNHAFKPGFFFAFGYFFAGLWWISNALLVEADAFAWALPLAIIVVPAVLALFWGVATGLSGLFWRGTISRIFLLAAMLGLAEYCRGFVATGFPWNTISYAAYLNPLSMQSASVLGIYGMVPFVVIVACLAGIIVPGATLSARSSKTYVMLCMSLVAAHIVFGFWRVSPEPSKTVADVSLRLVQPSIPQADKFSPEKHPEHLKRYLDLSTAEGADGKTGLSGTTHLFWPESVFPYLLTERKDTLASLSAMLPEGTSLITGAVRAESSSVSGGKNFVFNSAYVINDKGLIMSAADKVHLVPFGEYLPFQDMLERMGIQQLTKLEGGFEPGASRKLLSTGQGPQFLPLICYEIIFSGDIWNDQEDRPGFIANLTNDAWYGNSPGPYQHERQSVLRAVEEGLPLVRVANSGISGVYDAYGRTIYRLELGATGVIDSALPVALEPTIFSKFGGRIFIGIIGLFLFIAILPSFRRSRKIV